jgi:hypothetical protein
MISPELITIWTRESLRRYMIGIAGFIFKTFPGKAAQIHNETRNTTDDGQQQTLELNESNRRRTDWKFRSIDRAQTTTTLIGWLNCHREKKKQVPNFLYESKEKRKCPPRIWICIVFFVVGVIWLIFFNRSNSWIKRWMNPGYFPVDIAPFPRGENSNRLVTSVLVETPEKYAESIQFEFVNGQSTAVVCRSTSDRKNSPNPFKKKRASRLAIARRSTTYNNLAD